MAHSPLQSSGSISLNEVHVEINSNNNGLNVSMGDTDLRTMADISSGAISLSNFYGKSNQVDFVPNSATRGLSLIHI